MSAEVIVSYDGTANDEDALALGNLLARAGLQLALAYVRHSHEWDDRREQIAQHDAQHRLEQGALGLDDPDVACHVVFNASTPAGLEELAQREGASLLVFGSEYRTPPGRAEPGNSAQLLLEGGRVAVGVAAAGLRIDRSNAVRTIAVAPAEADDAAQRTASALADRTDATLVDSGDADLIIVGSQPDGPVGRISLGGSSRAALNAVRGSVIVLPAGTPLAL